MLALVLLLLGKVLFDCNRWALANLLHMKKKKDLTARHTMSCAGGGTKFEC